LFAGHVDASRNARRSTVVANIRFQVLVHNELSLVQQLLQARLTSGPGPFGWRLLGPNHRPLAVSGITFPNANTTLEAIADLQRLVPNDVVTRVTGIRTEDIPAEALPRNVGQWMWTAHASTRGPALMASARLYHRQRETNDAIGRALIAVIDAADERQLVLPRRTRPTTQTRANILR
jgi:hypothetical protein